MPETTIDIDGQISCVKRDADRELQAMQAVLATLERVRRERRPGLFEA